ncbi:DUF4224 domain-containing protein [Shewanella sp. 1_MG-2023]|uniref:DUF4224 domain-containing protein n=1 Tax=unclassified Shewanella TaxID=196818 RepID=UPI0026E2317E|nr:MULTISPECIES: DUF4224 domain-containing protein [unclassified Shewanella]MDO6610539.1 DUF4224 domain-containing protein [Shewanella sp. 7_MG-2023]MDO6770664.1 DUF4224 domain-containing protein [Shewanella sp. 2_MG-2023]MDO6795050.1 DUF4224 domain-containing protein [Shewanella sp. 1_MG-2023]
MALLTEKDLEQLSGFTQPAAQIKWLLLQGIKHFVRKDGRPSLTWDFVNNPNGATNKTAKPNFGALNANS